MLHNDRMDSLTTSRLLLRPWRTSDRSAFAAINADPVVMEYFPSILTAEQTEAMVDRIEVHIRQHGFGLWAVEIPNITEFAGFIGLCYPRFTASFTPCVESAGGWVVTTGGKTMPPKVPVLHCYTASMYWGLKKSSRSPRQTTVDQER